MRRVSMIVMRSPQFATQDDFGRGDGVAPISQWVDLTGHYHEHMSSEGLDPDICDILGRLHMLFSEPNRFNLSTTDLHDLTCFVLHRLLDRPTQSPYADALHPFSVSDCVRHAIALYLLIIHGPTYFSHAQLQYAMVSRLKTHLETFTSLPPPANRSITIWLLLVGMIASDGTPECQWFETQSRKAVTAYGIYLWHDVLLHLKKVLWLEKPHAEHIFQQKWDGVWTKSII
jgi:hypothetical protein